MGSLEDLFEREESTFETLGTRDKIVDWLSDKGKHGPGSSYNWVGKAFASTFKIRKQADRFEGTFEEVEDLRDLMNEAKQMTLHDPTTINVVKDKLSLAEEEEEKEVERQEQVRAEKEARRFIIDEYKEAETVEEERELRRTLKEELPYSLRSLKGWETRRGRDAFIAVFGRD